MTPRHIAAFVADIEAYYGEYRPAVRGAVLEELGKRRWPSQRACDEMLVWLRAEYSTRWRTPPGVKEILEAYQAIPPGDYSNRVASNAARITDSAGAIPDDETGEAYIRDLMTAWREHRIRRDDEPDDGRPTAYEFESQWRERNGVGA